MLQAAINPRCRPLISALELSRATKMQLGVDFVMSQPAYVCAKVVRKTMSTRIRRGRYPSKQNLHSLGTARQQSGCASFSVYNCSRTYSATQLQCSSDTVSSQTKGLVRIPTIVTQSTHRSLYTPSSSGTAIQWVSKHSRTNSVQISSKRLYSTSDRIRRLKPGETVPGFVLDIDGVLIRGDTVIPEAVEAMDILTNTTLIAEDGSESMGFPYVFVTNGGGSTELKKARQLSEWLEIDVPVEKVILSHTPMKKYSQLYDKNVLLVGQGPMQEIAANYGYKHTWTMEDVVNAYPLLHVMDKSKKYDPATSTGPLPPIDAVFVMIEPTHWEMNLQVLVDVLTSNKTIGELEPNHQAVPIWFTNPDFLWKAQHAHNRFGQGAFKLCLEALYEGYAGRPLESGQFGKPHALTYEFALQALKTQMGDKPGLSLGKVYGVGDNPTSDIRGANNQQSMSSIMVLTGVFNGADVHSNDLTDPADHVVAHVLDAVNLATRL